MWILLKITHLAPIHMNSWPNMKLRSIIIFSNLSLSPWIIVRLLNNVYREVQSQGNNNYIGCILFWLPKYHFGPIVSLIYLYLPLVTYIYPYFGHICPLIAWFLPFVPYIQLRAIGQLFRNYIYSTSIAKSPIVCANNSHQTHVTPIDVVCIVSN